MRELLETIQIPNYSSITEPGATTGKIVTASNGLNVYVTKSTATMGDGITPPVALLHAQWSDSAERAKQQARARIIADNIQGVAIAVDNPGVSLATPSMSPGIKRSLRDGDFSAVSHQQWDAIGELLDKEGAGFDAISQVVGYSLGTHIAASALEQAPGAVRIERLSLLETPGLRERGSSPWTAMAKLAMTFLRYGGQDLASVIKSNPGWASPCRHESQLLLPKLSLCRTAGLTYYPWAIAHPRNDIASKLIAAAKSSLKEAAIVIGATDADKVSPLDENRRLVQRLGSAGMKVIGLKVLNSVHGSQDNMAWWLALLREIDQKCAKIG